MPWYLLFVVVLERLGDYAPEKGVVTMTADIRVDEPAVAQEPYNQGTPYTSCKIVRKHT